MKFGSVIYCGQLVEYWVRLNRYQMTTIGECCDAACKVMQCDVCLVKCVIADQHHVVLFVITTDA